MRTACLSWLRSTDLFRIRQPGKASHPVECLAECRRRADAAPGLGGSRISACCRQQRDAETPHTLADPEETPMPVRLDSATEDIISPPRPRAPARSTSLSLAPAMAVRSCSRPCAGRGCRARFTRRGAAIRQPLRFPGRGDPLGASGAEEWSACRRSLRGFPGRERSRSRASRAERRPSGSGSASSCSPAWRTGPFRKGVPQRFARQAGGAVTAFFAPTAGQRRDRCSSPPTVPVPRSAAQYLRELTPRPAPRHGKVSRGARFGRRVPAPDSGRGAGTGLAGDERHPGRGRDPRRDAWRVPRPRTPPCATRCC